jgi:putative transcriptional regulator
MSMSNKTHPDSPTLMSFAAGTLAEPLAAVIAAHAAMCPQCRREIADMEMIGAALMLRQEPEPFMTRSLRADAVQRRHAPEQRAAAMLAPGERLPASIARAYDLSFDTIPWRRLGPGVLHHRLALSDNAVGDLRLLNISAGRRMPEHGHGGAELTLVIDGAYSDETGTYRRGDVQDVDGSTEHTPIADASAGCVCLIASEHPARFKGLVARLVQPWTGI